MEYRIPLIEYAKQHGRNPATARQRAARGAFKTAVKIGRDWMISPDEPWEDGRVKSGDYSDWRKKAKK